MAKTILRNCNVRIGGYNLTSRVNEIQMEVSVFEVDVTNFGSGGAVELLGGIKTSKLSFEGFCDLDSEGQPDVQFFADMAAQTPRPLSVTLSTPVMGDVAWFVNAAGLKHRVGGKVGDASLMSLMLASRSPLIQGRVLENNAGRTATGNSASYEFAAVGATQKLYYGVHVVGVSGTNPTLDLIIASDTATGFPSTTARATLAQATGITSYYGTVNGAITDTWYRIEATVGGTDTPTFTYFVVIGIQ